MKEERLGILFLAETQVNIASMAPHNYAALIFSSGSKMAGLMAGLIGELECPFIVG